VISEIKVNNNITYIFFLDSNTVNSETKEDKNRKYSIEQSHHFKIDASASNTIIHI